MVQDPLKGPFGFLMLKYAYKTLFLLFLTASSTPKTDKNSTLHYASINLRYFYVITYFEIYIFLYLYEKVSLWLFDLKSYAE